MEEKVLSLGKFNATATEGQGGFILHLGSLKSFFLELNVRPRKLTMMQKVIITFNSTYLIKVTYISSILKLLNTKSLEVQV